MNTVVSVNKCLRCGFIGVLLMTMQSFSALISLNPTASQVAMGNQMNVDILISDLGIEDDLSAFDFDLLYDPSIIEFINYSMTDNLGTVSDNLASDDSKLAVAPGQLNLASVSYSDDLSLQPEAFKLATVTFKGIAEGVSSLSFSNVVLADFFGDALPVVTKGGTISSVPEPSSMVLLGVGALSLCTFVLLRKRTSVIK